MGRRHEFAAIHGRVMSGVGAVVPLDLEAPPPLLCRPSVVGNDCNTSERLEARGDRRRRYLHDAFDPGHREGIAWVERCGPTSIYRAALDGRIFHSRESNIDAIGCCATDDIPEVDNWHRLSDIPAVLWVPGTALVGFGDSRPFS